MEKENKLALLIDADNTQASIATQLISEASHYGTIITKRAYGDWTTTNLKSWKEILLSLAIQPIQQFSYTKGKNATDSALIIDAMDLLYAGNLDGFCIVSSDSDFTKLSTRLRESGLKVYGFGEKKTPEPFIAACDKFIYTEILKESEGKEVEITKVALVNKELEWLIKKSIAGLAVGDDGWISLSLLGSAISKNSPSFDSRNYGYKRLKDLIKTLDYIKTKSVAAKNNGHTNLYVRIS